MRILKLQKKIRNLKKPYCTISDLQKILKLTNGSLRVSLHRLVRNDILVRVRRGIYMLPENVGNLDRVIGQIYYPCYVSFETALAGYGLINQIPYTLTFASATKSKKFTIGQMTVEIKKIRKNLFFGYKLEKGIFMAYPEKALLDQLYFVSLGKAKLDSEELNLRDIEKKKFFLWAKKFPLPTQSLAKTVAKQIGKTSITI